MRSTTWAVKCAVMMVALGMSGLVGCGSEQPEMYRVAVDVSPLTSLPASCYVDGRAPNSGNRTEGVMLPGQWLLWKGIDEQRYLEPGDFSLQLGDAGEVQLNGLGLNGRVGEEMVYGSELVRVFSEQTRRQQIVVRFDELGASMKGRMELSLSCSAGTLPCPPDCSVTLPFSGRRLDVDAETLYFANN